MRTIRTDTMVTVKLTDFGKKEIVAVGEGHMCMGDTIHCSLGMLMEVFGNACFCHKEQDQLFVDNEITIEGEPGPAERTGCTPPRVIPLETQLREVRGALGGEYKALDLASAVSLIRGDAKAYVDRNIEYRMREQEIRKALGDESSVSLPAVVRLVVEELGVRRTAMRDARKALRGYYTDMPIDEAIKGVMDLLRKAQGELARSKIDEGEKVDPGKGAMGGVTTAQAIENWWRAWQNYEKGTEESPPPRFRVTTNGEKFRVEELKKINPGGDSCVPIERWEPVGGGSTLLYRDTEVEAQRIIDSIERIKREEIAARPWVPVEEGTTTRQPEQEWATSALLAITEAKRLIGQHWPSPGPWVVKEPMELRLRTLEMLSSVIDRAAKGEAGKMSTEEGS